MLDAFGAGRWGGEFSWFPWYGVAERVKAAEGPVPRPEVCIHTYIHT